MAAIVFAHIIDGNDVRMVEPSGSLGFEQETADGCGASQATFAEHFERDHTVALDVPGAGIQHG